jgi:hypothetical protein
MMELLNIFVSDYKDSSDDKVDIAVTKLKFGCETYSVIDN